MSFSTAQERDNSMNVTLNGRRVKVPENRATINDLLELIDVNREEVIVALNGVISIEEEALTEGDDVKLIRAISGG
jgi:thiamine biosynthesis protein ThiS